MKLSRLAACSLWHWGPASADPPAVLIPDLVLEQVASEPDLVTPTGIAVDAKGRILVVENQTHFRPEGYAGPETDRVLLFEDADQDGKPERRGVFFEGARDTMGIAVASDGTIFLVTEDERTLTGVFVFENDGGEQRYADAEGGIFKIRTKEIRRRKPLNGSILPEGLQLLMTVDEFRDLIAYLKGG